MRFIIDDFEAPKAEKIFVDRIEPRQIFWQHYEQANSAPMEVPLVLSYYGVGGIGKTALNQQLKKELAAKYPKAKYLELDFDFVERREPYRILALMRKKLAEQYKFSFPMFEVAYYSLMLQMGEEANKPEAQSLVSSSPVLSFLCNSASFVPGGEIISSVLQLADEGIALFRNSFSKRKNMLKKLSAADPKQLLQELPIYFAADLRENLSKEKHPFVMFLDTYEKLVNEMAAIGDPLRNDLWLRGDKGIIARLPNVIWVIGGREKLKWDKLDVPGHWDGVLHQYLLGTLSQQDAAAFLENAGVTDPAVQREIYLQTEGLPVYLDLCVEQYLEDGQTALNRNRDALFERCTRYMNDQEKNILFLLACLETWTEESAYAAGQQMPFDFSPVFYEKLLSFSFVLTNDGIHYTLMRQIGQILREHCPPAIRRACMNLMVQAAEPVPQAAEAVPEEPAQMDVSRYMQLLLADIHNEDDLDAVMNDLEDHLLELIESYQLSSFYDYLEPLWHLAVEHYRDSYAFARLQTFYSMALYKIGEYEQAEQHGVESLQQLQRIKGELSAVEIAMSNMATQYSDRCLFQKIPQLFASLWQEIADTFGEDHIVAQNIAHIIAVSYGVLEQTQEEALWKKRFSQQVIAELVEQYEPTEMEQELTALCEKAEQLWAAQDYQGYVDQQLAAINRGQELYGPYSLEMLKMMEDLAKRLNDMKLHEDAIEVQQEAVTRYTDSIGLHDGTTAMARASLYNYLCDNGRGAEALEMAPEIIEDLNRNFGEQFAMSLNFRFNVACERMIQLEEEIAGEEDLLAILQVMEELREEMLACPMRENTLLREVEDMIAVLKGESREEPEPKPKKAAGGVSVEAARGQRAAEKRVDDIWIIGDAMEKRIKKAVNTYAVDIDETDVLLQADGTVRRNGKAGFVFTKDMVFFKSTFDEGSALISNIEDIRPGKTEVLLQIKGRKSPVKVITAQEQAVARVLRAFLGMD